MFTGLNFNFESDEERVCSFTGYRPNKLPFLNRKNSTEYFSLRELLKNEIIGLAENGITIFQTGMARGVDLLCGEIVLEVQKKHDIHLFCAIPCKNQCSGWGSADIDVYNRLLGAASGVTYITSDDYRDGCMMKRNRFLVDTSQYILAVYDGQRGGTMSTINYAKKKKRTVIIINPTDFTRVELLHGNEKGVLYV